MKVSVSLSSVYGLHQQQLRGRMHTAQMARQTGMRKEIMGKE